MSVFCVDNDVQKAAKGVENSQILNNPFHFPPTFFHSKIAGLALLSASVSADLASMQKLYQQVLDIKKNGTDGRVRAPGQEGPNARFVPGVRFIFSMIQEYGCWCYSALTKWVVKKET